MRLQASGLRIRPEKCYFQVDRFNFLGYDISTTGVRPMASKINVLKNMPPPKDRKSLRRFLGFGSFYRRFVPHYAQLSSPLNQLANNKSPFVWSAENEKAFRVIVHALSSAKVLSLVCKGKPFELHTDENADETLSLHLKRKVKTHKKQFFTCSAELHKD